MSIKSFINSPFPYHSKGSRFPDNILLEYNKRYRKKLTPEVITEFLCNESKYDLAKNVSLIKELYDINENNILNLDLTPDQIYSLFDSFRYDIHTFIKIIHILTNRTDIFEGPDLINDAGKVIKNPLDSRSYKIFKTLY